MRLCSLHQLCCASVIDLLLAPRCTRCKFNAIQQEEEEEEYWPCKEGWQQTEEKQSAGQIDNFVKVKRFKVVVIQSGAETWPALHPGSAKCTGCTFGRVEFNFICNSSFLSFIHPSIHPLSFYRHLFLIRISQTVTEREYHIAFTPFLCCIRRV